MTSVRMDKWLWAARFFKTEDWPHELVNSVGFNPTGSPLRLRARSALETCCE